MVIEQQRAPRKLSRQERRLAARQQAKARTLPTMHQTATRVSWGEGLTPIGVALAEVLPTHEQGEWRLGSGWVSDDDTMAWHEAAHAVVTLSYGWRVIRLGLEGLDTSSGAGMQPAGRSTDFHPDRLVDTYRSLATVSLAGAAIVAQICQDALGFSGRLLAEAISDTDQPAIDRARQIVPESAEELHQACSLRAITIVNQHRNQFGALVSALLVHRVMDEAQVLDVWNAAA